MRRRADASNAWARTFHVWIFVDIVFGEAVVVGSCQWVRFSSIMRLWDNAKGCCVGFEVLRRRWVDVLKD